MGRRAEGSAVAASLSGVRSVDPGTSEVFLTGVVEKVVARPAVVVGNLASTQRRTEYREVFYLRLPIEGDEPRRQVIQDDFSDFMRRYIDASLSLEIGYPVRAVGHGLRLGSLDNQWGGIPGMLLHPLGRFFFLRCQDGLFFRFPVGSLGFGHGCCS